MEDQRHRVRRRAAPRATAAPGRPRRRRAPGSGGSLRLETLAAEKTAEPDRPRRSRSSCAPPASAPTGRRDATRADLVLDLETTGPGGKRLPDLSRMELQARDRPDGLAPPHVDFDVSVTLRDATPGRLRRAPHRPRPDRPRHQDPGRFTLPTLRRDPRLDPPPRAASRSATRRPRAALAVAWDDGHVSVFPLDYLRSWCPCAGCQGHDPVAHYLDLHGQDLTHLEGVGNYALGLTWADGHSTGIYSFRMMRGHLPLRRVRRREAMRQAWTRRVVIRSCAGGRPLRRAAPAALFAVMRSRRTVIGSVFKRTPWPFFAALPMERLWLRAREGTCASATRRRGSTSRPSTRSRASAWRRCAASPRCSSSAATPDRRSGGRFPPSTRSTSSTATARRSTSCTSRRPTPPTRGRPGATSKDKVLFATPRSFEDRAEVGATCVKDLKIDLPMVVDEIDNRTERAYTAWPDRLYVIDADGPHHLQERCPGPSASRSSRWPRRWRPWPGPRSSRARAGARWRRRRRACPPARGGRPRPRCPAAAS